MTLEEAMEIVNKSTSVGEWEQEDQLQMFFYLIEYAKKLKPLVDKYDTSKPFRFEYRRLD